MFDIKRLLHVLLATSMLGTAATAVATAASHPSAPNHTATQRINDRDGDKSKRDPSEDKADKRDKADKGDQGDLRDHRNPPA
jgi:Ni/Co efflux regulator RcnB